MVFPKQTLVCEDVKDFSLSTCQLNRSSSKPDLEISPDFYVAKAVFV